MPHPHDLELLRVLLRIVLDDNPAAASGSAGNLLSQAKPSVWKKVLQILEDDRVTAIIYGRLEARGLAEALPQEVRSQMQQIHTRAVDANKQRLSLLAKVLELLRQDGVEPVVLKSAALVCMFPQKMSGHEMTDVDLYVFRQDMAQLERTLGGAGFSCPETTGHAVYFEDPDGILKLDVHHRFELFEQHDINDLLVHVEAKFPPVKTIRVFKPNARLVHLIWHLNDHREIHGYQLRWILDLGVVLQAWGEQFDIQLLRRLMPSSVCDLWLVRLVNFYDQELGLTVLEKIVRPNNAVEPMTLTEMLRSRRVASWPLTSLRGWRSLIACLAGVRAKDRRIYPKLSDLPLHIADLRRERQASEAFAEAFVQS